MPRQYLRPFVLFLFLSILFVAIKSGRLDEKFDEKSSVWSSEYGAKSEDGGASDDGVDIDVDKEPKKSKDPSLWRRWRE